MLCKCPLVSSLAKTVKRLLRNDELISDLFTLGLLKPACVNLLKELTVTQQLESRIVFQKHVKNNLNYSIWRLLKWSLFLRSECIFLSSFNQKHALVEAERLSLCLGLFPVMISHLLQKKTFMFYYNRFIQWEMSQRLSESMKGSHVMFSRVIGPIEPCDGRLDPPPRSHSTFKAA